jgi:hypothetical protein
VLILGSSGQVKIGYDAISDGEHDKRSQSVDTEGEEGIDGWGNMTESRIGRREVGRGDSQEASSSFIMAPA